MSQKYQAFDEREREKHGKNCSLLGRNLSSAPVSGIIFWTLKCTLCVLVVNLCTLTFTYVCLCLILIFVIEVVKSSK